MDKITRRSLLGMLSMAALVPSVLLSSPTPNLKDDKKGLYCSAPTARISVNDQQLLEQRTQQALDLLHKNGLEDIVDLITHNLDDITYNQECTGLRFEGNRAIYNVPSIPSEEVLVPFIGELIHKAHHSKGTREVIEAVNLGKFENIRSLIEEERDMLGDKVKAMRQLGVVESVDTVLLRLYDDYVDRGVLPKNDQRGVFLTNLQRYRVGGETISGEYDRIHIVGNPSEFRIAVDLLNAMRKNAHEFYDWARPYLQKGVIKVTESERVGLLFDGKQYEIKFNYVHVLDNVYPLGAGEMLVKFAGHIAGLNEREIYGKRIQYAKHVSMPTDYIQSLESQLKSLK